MADAQPMSLQDFFAAAHAAGATRVVLTSGPGVPSPLDVCSPGRYRRALRRVYTRAEAERLWRENTLLGLDRPAFLWEEDALFPVALLSPTLRARVRWRLQWSRRTLNARLRTWCRDALARPDVRAGWKAERQAG